MIAPGRFVAAVLLGILVAPRASSQDRVSGTTLPVAQTTLYLVEITQTEQIPALPDVNKFATTFLGVRLARLPGVKVMRVATPPVCGSELAGIQQNKAQLQTTVTSREDSFFMVSGSIEVHRASIPAPGETAPAINELVLNYDLIKRVGCQPSPVFHRFETFTEGDMLDTFSVAGNLLAAKLAAELKPRVDIQVAQFAKEKDSEGADQNTVRDGLIDAIVSRLAVGNVFRPRDLRQVQSDPPAEYKLETTLDFKREKNPLGLLEHGRLLGTLSGVEASFFVVVSEGTSSGATHRYQVTSSAITGSLSDRDKFYMAAAHAVAQGLQDVRSAREAHLTEQLDKLEKNAGVTLAAFNTKVLLARAEEFLCVDTPDPCSPKADAALPVLNELAQRPQGGETPEVLLLLGRAQYLTGQYRKAGQTFDLALSNLSSKTPQESVELLNDAGNAWYKAQEYSKAAQYYKQSLETSATNSSTLPDKLRSQPEVQVQLARSLRFDGRRTDALEALIAGAKTVTNPSRIVLELRELMLTLPPSELANAVNRIETANDPSLAPALAAGYIRTAALLAARQDFQGAAQTVEKAIAIKDSQQAEFFLALYSYQWANAPKDGAIPPPPSYKKIAELALPLVQKRYREESDWLLMQANHEIGADRDTKDVFDAILAQKPKDLSALTQRMFLCNEYLKDLDCALETAMMAQQASTQGNQSLALDIAEIYVLKGKHDEALQRIQAIVADPDLEPRLRAVASFYLTWSLLALNRGEDARHAAARWKLDLTTVRNGKVELRWVFNGAQSALARQPQITATKKGFLTEMLTAMIDPGRPVPDDPLPPTQ